MLRNMGPAGESGLFSLINALWVKERLPLRWKTALIQPIPKPKDSGKTRSISLLSTIAKTTETMVLNRLKWMLGEPHRNIYGSANGKSALHSIVSLLAMVNNHLAIIVFLDLDKAFELASPNAIANALAARGVRGRSLKWAHDYLRNRTPKVRFQGHHSLTLTFKNVRHALGRGFEPRLVQRAHGVPRRTTVPPKRHLAQLR